MKIQFNFDDRCNTEFFNNRYYKLSKELLTCIGAWSFQNWKSSWLRRTVVFLSTTFGMFMLISKFYTTKCTWDLFAELLPIITIGVLYMIKYINTFINANKIKTLWINIEMYWTSLKNREELKIIENESEVGRLYILFYVLYYYVAIFVYISASLLPIVLDIISPLDKPRPRKPIIRAEFYIDTEKYFYPILLMCYLFSGMAVTVMMAIDAMFLTFVYHACGIFCVTGYYFEHLFDRKEGEIFVDTASQIKKIRNAVEQHRTAIRFIGKLNDCFGWSKFLIVGLCSCAFCVSLFCVTIFVGQWREMFLSVLTVVSQLIYGILYIYPAQKLMDQSSDLTQRIYSSKWYTTPNNIQKLLVPIMRRTLTPSSILVGRMFSYSFEYFVAGVQTTFSYFTALYSLQ